MKQIKRLGALGKNVGNSKNDAVSSSASRKRWLNSIAPAMMSHHHHNQQHTKHHTLTEDNMNENLREMQYAVRGEVPIAAHHLAQEMKRNPGSKPFDEILYCNIGNPQAVGQKYISYYRHVTSLVDSPRLLEKNENMSALTSLYGRAAVDRAKEMVGYMGAGSGAYSGEQGVERIRQNVATFIENRDGYDCDPENIFLSNGASSAIQMLLTATIANENDAVMVPLPQYPLYTALIKILGGKAAGYYLNEEKSWSLDDEALELAYRNAVNQGQKPRAMVVINPGNPTGSVLSYDDITRVIHFCDRHDMILLADEVYQENCYNPDKPFHSFKKVMNDIGVQIELASFHSTSKGFIGECGRRGGYMEMCNFDPKVQSHIVKLASSGLCSNLNGQMMTDLMVRGPSAGAALEKFTEERDTILHSLKEKSEMVYHHLNATPGVSCQPLDGAMYAFPKIDLPNSFIQKALAAGKQPDTLYALSLLENTGICAVPGSGFGQKEGTWHLRLTFLPDPQALEEAMKRFKDHHLSIK